MFKKMLPFEKITYRSTLSKEELTQSLKDTIAAKSYNGKINNDTFELQRAISYRNSFLPQIKGKITQTMNGTRIDVEMNLLPFVKIFMSIWLGGVVLALVATSYSFLFQNNPNSANGFPILIPFSMLIIGIVMVVGGFKFESKKSIQDLKTLMQAKIEDR